MRNPAVSSGALANHPAKPADFSSATLLLAALAGLLTALLPALSRLLGLLLARLLLPALLLAALALLILLALLALIHPLLVTHDVLQEFSPAMLMRCDATMFRGPGGQSPAVALNASGHASRQKAHRS
jgi:hypothetical protein